MLDRIRKQLQKVKHSDNRGMSLVELLVAMTVLAVLTLPMFSTFASSAKINSNARKLEEANIIGEKTVERFKAVSVDTLADAVTGTDAAAKKAALGIGNVTTSMDAQGFAYYDFDMATFAGLTADMGTDKDGNPCPCYIGSNGVKYYVEASLSPTEYSQSGSTGTVYPINTKDVPSFADVNDTENCIIMDQIYRYDTSIKNILPAKSTIIREATYDAMSSLIAKEETSLQTNLEILADIKKVVVLRAEVSHVGDLYTLKPLLSVKYYRPHGSDEADYYTDSDGDIVRKSKDGAVETVTSSGDDVFIKEYHLAEQNVNLTNDNWKDIYLFYTSYDRQYNSSRSGGQSQDEVFIQYSGAAVAAKPVNVYLIDQKTMMDNETESEVMHLQGSNVTVTGTGFQVFSNVTGITERQGGITQNYKQQNEKYLYTVTVNIWAEENGRKPDTATAEPYLTLTATKENQ